MKEDWEIEDFTPYLIKKEHFLDHAAYLYHKVNPAFDRMENPAYPHRTYLAEAIAHDEAAILYGPNPSYEYRGPLPDEVWQKIKETYKLLLTAAKEGTLLTRGPNKADADDLRKFFYERLGEKPSFLFRNGTPLTSPGSENYFKMNDADFQLWDLRNELTVAEAACLCLDLNPNKCVSYFDKNAPSWALEIIYNKNLTLDFKTKIGTMVSVLEEARKNEEIEETTAGLSWMAQPFSPRLSRAGLKEYAEKNGLRPLSLFPYERGKQRPKDDRIFPSGEGSDCIRMPEMVNGDRSVLFNVRPESSIMMRSEGEELSVSQKEGWCGAADYAPSATFRHSDDFHSVTWNGKNFSFTSRQAQVIEILYRAYKNGTPELGKDYILEKLDSPSSRLRDSFKNSPAWGSLIIRGKKRGSYRLNL